MKGLQHVRSGLSILALFVLLSHPVWAQQGTDESAVGYLRIFTDADLVQIYVDGEMIGYSPILEKITVIPGWHHVSFFSPNFKWEHWTHRQRRVLMNVVEAGTYRVHVNAGELTEVHMAWHELEQALERYESGRVITALVGIGMIGAVLILLALVV
ncbi:MAG: hypothetical protein JSU61_12825 [Fidelibacterota bacterium]|nr:MAG: hypothetical protein JSU61_12825 [Candidatus Neomarinimicrobiota bacterium]